MLTHCSTSPPCHVVGASAASLLLNDNGEIFLDVTANSMDRREATLINDTEQPPITIVMLISHHITLLKNSGQLDSFHAIAMEDRLTRWVDEFGAHERYAVDVDWHNCVRHLWCASLSLSHPHAPFDLCFPPGFSTPRRIQPSLGRRAASSSSGSPSCRSGSPHI